MKPTESRKAVKLGDKAVYLSKRAWGWDSGTVLGTCQLTGAYLKTGLLTFNDCQGREVVELPICAKCGHYIEPQDAYTITSLTPVVKREHKDCPLPERAAGCQDQSCWNFYCGNCEKNVVETCADCGHVFTTTDTLCFYKDKLYCEPCADPISTYWRRYRNGQRDMDTNDARIAWDFVAEGGWSKVTQAYSFAYTNGRERVSIYKVKPVRVNDSRFKGLVMLGPDQGTIDGRAFVREGSEWIAPSNGDKAVEL